MIDILTHWLTHDASAFLRTSSIGAPYPDTTWSHVAGEKRGHLVCKFRGLASTIPKYVRTTR
jgi:hypothetical protein